VALQPPRNELPATVQAAASSWATSSPPAKPRLLKRRCPRPGTRVALSSSRPSRLKFTRFRHAVLWMKSTPPRWWFA
jgi:hypothetical protein